MFVRLTFVKRFMKHKFLYHRGRVYNVDERLGMELCSTMVNDMPVFSIVDPAKIGETPVVNLSVEEDAQEEEAPIPKTVKDIDKPTKNKQVRKAATVTKKTVAKKAATKKAAPRLKKKAAAPKSNPANEVEI
jgi:hypothetical protein